MFNRVTTLRRVERPVEASSSWNDPPLTLTVEEMAALLHISRATAYKLVRQDGFPSLMIGNRIVVSYRGLQQWIDAQSQDKGCGKESQCPDSN